MKISTLVFSALAILSTISVDACTPPAPSPDISSIINKDLFEELLKHRNDDACDGKGFYTYDAFIAAAKSFDGFGTTGDDDTRKRELAAFFAHTSYRTSGGRGLESQDGKYAWGYCIVREPGNHPPPYCTSPDWPCAYYKSYHGRGPLQLRHNHNYGKAGKGIGVDLINNPELVETDPIISFKTAIWFWMTAQDNKPSPHDVMVGKWTPSDEDVSAGRLQGFGVVTNIFNSWACGKGPNEGVDDPIGFYKRYSDILGVGYGENIDCYCQKPYGSPTSL